MIRIRMIVIENGSYNNNDDQNSQVLFNFPNVILSGRNVTIFVMSGQSTSQSLYF